jgi:AcrR family transcriptional regulator
MAPEARHEQVLAVAAKVFTDKGYRMAAVTDIVEGACIGRGTFYLYFDSKRDAFLELIERYFTDFENLLAENHERLKASVKSGGNVLATWRENIIRIFEYHRDNPHLTSVVYREALGTDEDFSARVDELSRIARKMFHEQFNLMKRHGLIRAVNLDVVASIVMGSTVYVIMEHIMKGGTPNLERLTDEMIEYHVRALMTPGPGLEAALDSVPRIGARAKKKAAGEKGLRG